jgi:pyridoxal 5'-phosphate synthase pdxT subunit
MRIGVLALQGAFQEHCAVLTKLGIDAVEVRTVEQLGDLDGLIIPGGESTTIGKLASWYGLLDELRKKAARLPVWGTCCGLVFMARDVGMDQPLLGIMDTVVERNAFGRQVDSFEEELDIEGLEGGPFHGIFIRAPLIKEVGEGVAILGTLKDGRIVAVRQGAMLATSFHPELTKDDRLHRYFIEMIKQSKGRTKS